jgi:tripartite-type tricarboxylate transporter receptor subunit TctC
MKPIARSRAAFFLAGTFAFAAPAVATAEPVADFYNGKNVQVIIPASLGGSIGLYGRLVNDHLCKHIPGSPTCILLTMPGGGGVKSMEFMVNVGPKDGTAVAEILSPTLLVPMTRKVRFDPLKLGWLGSLTARPSAVGLWYTARATTLEGAKKVSLNMGSTGVGSGNYQIPTLANALLGTKFKLVTGYRGGADINLAIERREVDGRSNYWTGYTLVKPQWIREKKIRLLFHTGPRAPDMPAGLPAFADLVSGEARQMVRIQDAPDHIGVGFYMASGIPADRMAALRKAFWDMMHDKDFLADAAKLKAPIAPQRPQDMQKIVEEVYATPAAVIERYKKAILGKK